MLRVWSSQSTYLDNFLEILGDVIAIRFIIMLIGPRYWLVKALTYNTQVIASWTQCVGWIEWRQRRCSFNHMREHKCNKIVRWGNQLESWMSFTWVRYQEYDVQHQEDTNFTEISSHMVYYRSQTTRNMFSTSSKTPSFLLGLQTQSSPPLSYQTSVLHCLLSPNKLISTTLRNKPSTETLS